MARTQDWAAKLLSYARRAHLVKSVLLSMQIFWCQIFILSKKILKEVQGLCRSYLWTGKAQLSRNALVSWEKVCFPKSCGGLNFTHLDLWNKAAIAKHFWAVALKQDKFWIQLIHSYYIKHANI